MVTCATSLPSYRTVSLSSFGDRLSAFARASCSAERSDENMILID